MERWRRGARGWLLVVGADGRVVGEGVDQGWWGDWGFGERSWG